MKTKLNQEENDILKSFENKEWKPVPYMKNEIKQHINYARATNRKDKRVNIRISAKDLESIQIKAMEDGIPYQTLISSLLHKYVNGRLTERKS